MTTREELFEIFDEITEKAFEVMQGKNSDYASDEDSLANFRSSEVLNVDPRKALLIRMLDKIKRQVNYIERGELSVDSAEDDIIDLINYSVLLHALNREKEFEEAYEATKDKVPSFNDEDWGVSLLKENLTWLDEHHYPATPEETTEVPEFCDTPNACYHDGCSCERTNKFVEEENVIETQCIYEDDRRFDVYLKSGYAERVPDSDVQTDDELTITQIETTDGTIYRT